MLKDLAMRRKWTGESPDGNPADSQTLPSVSELQSNIQAIRDMGYTPANRGTMVHIIVAAGLLFLPVVVKLVPLDNILKWAVGKILWPAPDCCR